MYSVYFQPLEIGLAVFILLSTLKAGDIQGSYKVSACMKEGGFITECIIWNCFLHCIVNERWYIIHSEDALPQGRNIWQCLVLKWKSSQRMENISHFHWNDLFFYAGFGCETLLLSPNCKEGMEGKKMSLFLMPFSQKWIKIYWNWCYSALMAHNTLTVQLQENTKPGF